MLWVIQYVLNGIHDCICQISARSGDATHRNCAYCQTGKSGLKEIQQTTKTTIQHFCFGFGGNQVILVTCVFVGKIVSKEISIFAFYWYRPQKKKERKEKKQRETYWCVHIHLHLKQSYWQFSSINSHLMLLSVCERHAPFFTFFSHMCLMLSPMFFQINIHYKCV